ncbi:hypothetical protein GCM10025876_26960 [Demequina litorisediminis]|uniref:Uncharacterized protein n=1 Tax=Demequina litorisediminis TaxID=1849022 RepID=A0ABQ6IF24_9MICO|nr:hypothetical protein GCM10025876_26960 [Demequina litorisediminis]
MAIHADNDVVTRGSDRDIQGIRGAAGGIVDHRHAGVVRQGRRNPLGAVSRRPHRDHDLHLAAVAGRQHGANGVPEMSSLVTDGKDHADRRASRQGRKRGHVHQGNGALTVVPLTPTR